jgi:hypothetical protein
MDYTATVLCIVFWCIIVYAIIKDQRKPPENYMGV